MQGARLGRLPFSGSGAPKRPEAPADTPVAERLPLFSEMLDRAAGGGRCVLMDLAPASPASIALGNELHCRLEIVGFPEALPELARSRDVEDFGVRIDALLPNNPQHPASHVLCWDFLNYLPRGAITLLMDHIAARSRADVRIHALIAYSAPQMPARPCRYTPDGRQGVQIRPVVDDTRESPRYTPKDLLRCMPGFEIGRAMMLRNGFQEYILQRKQEADAPPAAQT